MFEDLLAALRLGARPRSARWRFRRPRPGRRRAGRRRSCDAASAGAAAPFPGVTCHSLGFGHARHWSTWPRTSLMIEVGSYCCSRVESPLPSSKTKSCWRSAFLAFLRLGDGRDEFGAATVLDDLLGRLALRIELPMPPRDTRTANSGSDAQRKGCPSSDPARFRAGVHPVRHTHALLACRRALVGVLTESRCQSRRWNGGVRTGRLVLRAQQRSQIIACWTEPREV